MDNPSIYYLKKKDFQKVSDIGALHRYLYQDLGVTQELMSSVVHLDYCSESNYSQRQSKLPKFVF